MNDVCGRAGASLLVSPGPAADWSVALEYVGRDVVFPFGDSIPAGQPVRFGWSRFFAPIDWKTASRWWSRRSTGSGGSGIGHGWRGFRSSGGRFARRGRSSYRSASTGSKRSATTGSGWWVDGRLAIDAWDPHESRVDAARVSGGRHDLAVEYYQVDGWVELSVDIQPAGPR